MVRIDGAKVRKIRESKGLTQLYLATAVDVTTDTISRWENRRYPTIKKENGIRLAEALEVELSEILETEERQDAAGDGTEETAGASAELWPGRRVTIFLLIGITLIVLAAAFIGFRLFSHQATITVTARRTLPVRAAEGQTFPVVIELSGLEEPGQSIILKESLPAGSVVLKTYPQVAAINHSGLELKWLNKIDQKARFTYLMQLQVGAEERKIAEFSGTVAAANGEIVNIEGDSRVVVDLCHWADRNGDGVISDSEILHVYDEFSGIEGFDIEQVEQIWAGSGYRWDKKRKLFEIIE